MYSFKEVEKIDRRNGFIEGRYGLPNLKSMSLKDTKLLLLIGKPETGSKEIPIEWVEELGGYSWNKATHEMNDLLDEYKHPRFEEERHWDWLKEALPWINGHDRVINFVTKSPQYQNPLVNAFKYTFCRNDDYVSIKKRLRRYWKRLHYKGLLFEFWFILGFIVSMIATNLPKGGSLGYLGFFASAYFIVPQRRIIKNWTLTNDWTRFRKLSVYIAYWFYLSLVFVQSINLFFVFWAS